MSVYGPCNLELVMNKKTDIIELEESPNSENKIIQPTFNPFSLLFFDILFKNNFLKTKEDILKYILEIMKKEDIMDLNVKYICSIYLNMNKNLLTKEIIEEILSQEFHLTLMNWLEKEKIIIEDLNNNNIYKYYIFIGLLINIINLYEIFPIKSCELKKYKLYEKLFNINKLIKLNINNSFPFLQSLKNILIKWKKQINCFYLTNTIQNFNFLNKKIKRNNYKTINDKNCNDYEIDKNETASNSDEKEEFKAKNKNKMNKKKKQVSFNLEKNQIIYFNNENCPLQFL